MGDFHHLHVKIILLEVTYLQAFYLHTIGSPENA
jgi:hypothetical protein